MNNNTDNTATAPLTENERRAIRAAARKEGTTYPIHVETSGRARRRRPRKRGQSSYHTTLSGKTIINHPSAYRWPMLYHASTNRILVGAAWVDRLRRIVSGRPYRWGAALPGEIAVRIDARTARRYHADTLRPAGIAIRMPVDMRSRFGQWEHGRSCAACQREIARKREALAHEEREREVSDRDRRAARLLARISRCIAATYSDARRAGLCRAGILQWCRQRGVSPEAAIPVRLLARDHDHQARELAVRVAMGVIRARRDAS